MGLRSLMMAVISSRRTTTSAAPLSAPSGLSATAVSDTQINLSWTDTNTSPNETEFEIFRSTDNISFSSIGTSPADDTTYSDTTCTPATLYYYKVKAKGNGSSTSDSSYSNTDSDTTTSGPFYATMTEGIVSDSGYYDSFQMGKQLEIGRPGAIQIMFCRKPGHVPKGNLIIATSEDGGSTWDEEIVTVGGVEIESHAHSIGWDDDTGRQILFYQDGDAPLITVKWATREGDTGDFTYRGTITKNASCDYIAPAPIETKRMPEGQWRFAYYEGTDAGDLFRMGFYESSDNGTNFTFSHIAHSGTTMMTGPVSDWGALEFDWLCVDDTGVNATSKFIILARLVTSIPDGGVYYKHFRSLGGTTWISDSTTDAGSFVDDNGGTVSGPFSREIFYTFLLTNSPPWLAIHNGKVIAGTGERNVTNGFKSKITWATPAGAYENKFNNWIRPITIHGFNANYLGSTIDCGYDRPLFYKETVGGPVRLGKTHYDVSPYTKDAGITEDRCHIGIMDIEDWLYFPSGTARTDIITGSSFFSGYTSDFNADHSYDGDSEEYIQLPAGTKTRLEWRGKGKGVKLVGPESGVCEITEFIAFGDYTEDIVVMSHPNNPLREDSFIFNDAGQFYFTVYSRGTGRNLIKAVSITSARIGMQIETRLSTYANLAAFPGTGALDHNYRALDTGIEYSWDGSAYVVNTFPIAQQVQNVKILNCKIDGTFYEGIYNGADLGSPIPTNSTVRNTHTLVTGRDGVQLRNGYLTCIDVTVDDAGDSVEGGSVHGHGTPMGANSSGALLQRVRVNSAFANGLFSNALGVITCEVCSFIATTEYGGYMNNYTSTTENVAGMSSITYNLVNCHFEGFLGALRIQRDAAKLPMTVNRYSTNTYTGSVTIETGNGIVDNVLT